MAVKIQNIPDRHLPAPPDLTAAEIGSVADFSPAPHSIQWKPISSGFFRDAGENELFALLRICPEEHRTPVINAITERNVRWIEKLAERVAGRLPPGQVDAEDLLQEAILKLPETIVAYDPDSGVKFETYAAFRMRGAMLDAIRSWDPMPRTLRTKAKCVVPAIEEFRNKNGYEPTDAELAGVLDVAPEQIGEYRLASRLPRSESLFKVLYEAKGDNLKDTKLEDDLCDRRTEPADYNLTRREEMAALMKGLNKAERILLIGYIYEGRSLKEVGEQCLGLSESRASQMLTSIVDHIRKNFLSQIGRDTMAGYMLNRIGIRIKEDCDTQVTLSKEIADRLAAMMKDQGYEGGEALQEDTVRKAPVDLFETNAEINIRLIREKEEERRSASGENNSRYADFDFS